MTEVAPVKSELATWQQRVIAFLIDIAPCAVLWVVGVIIGRLFTTTKLVEVTSEWGFTYSTQATAPSLLGTILGWICFLAAFGFFIWNKGMVEGTTGQSLGKRKRGLRTVGAESSTPLGVEQGVIRSLLLIVDFAIVFIGVLWPLWDPQRQCLLSDRVTKAIVVS